jgi:hypothetical protein
MSDIAPFVAAVIRDRVVEELGNENETLRQEMDTLRLQNQQLHRTLHERNPRRSVKLTGPNGSPVIAEYNLHLSTAIQRFPRTHFTLFRGNPVDHPASLRFPTLRHLLRAEIWIDGGRAVRLRDLVFRYTAYKYVDTWQGWQYFATLCARDGDDLILEAEISLPLDDHAKLLRRDSCVDFAPPAVLDSDRYYVEHSADEEIPISYLLELCGENDAIIFFNHWMCTGDYFVRHLTVPYMPVEDH